ncbi:sulfatase [Chitinophagaceae bacterium LB-8]|uniref:Sulfatase n=1 Tax=Paraflavisolibacter caeni TaxID=2982496 RepID=A0A9X2XQ72_9BACT|nr:sulfatase [Paraflavisolibacter caeni]MCU7552869.1 sulfatase [Paraflavisolibacter caeni]
MQLNDALTILCICMFFLFSQTLPATAQKKPNQNPNVVIILADQWREQAIGYLGKEKVQTPHIDSFAKGSLTITQMVSNYPVCSPARAMLLTGTYPLKNKVYSNVNSASGPYGVELPADMICWSDILKAKGYSNGYIGKWHLDSPHKPFIPTSNNTEKLAWNEWTPFEKRHGFDYWYAYGTYDVHNHPMYWDTKAPRDSFHYVNQWGPEHEVDKALEFISNKKGLRKEGAPFSLVVSMNPPHSEYQTVPEKYYARYKNIPMDSLLTDPNIPPAGTPMGDDYRKDVKYYYANITGIDEQIGRLINGLKDHRLLDNTIVIITADHGNCLGKHDEVSKNNIYEESLRIPLIIYWKEKIKPGIDEQFLGSMPDLFPTLLELTGYKKAIPKSIDGQSYASYFLNRSGPMPAEQFIMGGVPSSNVKLNAGFRGIRTARYKLAYQKKGSTVEGFLFDLKNDPYELNNLYNRDHEQVKVLRPKLLQWLRKTNDSFVVNE